LLDQLGQPAAQIERDRAPLRARAFGVDRSKQALSRARRRRTQGFVEMNGLRHFLAHQLEAAGELRVIGERLLDPFGVARLNVPAACHGNRTSMSSRSAPCLSTRSCQPLSTPAAFSSSDNFFRA